MGAVELVADRLQLTLLELADLDPPPGSDVPGAREAGLKGMAAAGLSDVAYQEAYRDCMESRGF